MIARAWWPLVLVLGLTVGVVSPSWAGPNAGGRLLVHDTGLAYSYDSTSYPSTPPASCEAADVQAPPDSFTVWKIYASFPEASSPRLKALALGEMFDPVTVTVLDGGLPSPLDFEIPQDGWPFSPNGGNGISFGVTQTGLMVEVYWFGGYGAYGGAFEACPHPVQPSLFVDDAIPPNEDPIAAFRSMGFGVDGGPPCWAPPSGACCFLSTGQCEMLDLAACAAAGGEFHGGECAPNPCPQPPPQSGEILATAWTIGSLPFSDASSSCGYLDDYDEACPYPGSISPDVVYRYVPAQGVEVWIDLCQSQYDTKLYVYDGDVDHLVACSDDAGCGYFWESRIDHLLLIGGHTYYIVVDGYGGTCGEYALNVGAHEPCVVDCPEGALVEGEPPCVDGYYDQYNGGCSQIGWSPIEAVSNGCATLCGRSCTFVRFGETFRDTDWFTVNALGGEVTFRCTAEFPLLTAIIYGLDCANLQYLMTSAETCVEASSTWTASAGQELWLWIAPSIYSGVPESDYVMEVCGITSGVIPVEEVSWGRVKARFLENSRREAAGDVRPSTPGPTTGGRGVRTAPTKTDPGRSAVLSDRRLGAKLPVKPGR